MIYDKETLREVKKRLTIGEGRTEAYEATLAWIDVQLADPVSCSNQTWENYQ